MWTGNRSLERTAAQLRAFMAALSQARWALLSWILVSAGAALWYAMAARPEFVAKVDILVAPQQIATSGPHGTRGYNRLGEFPDEAVTELRVLCSDGVLRAALDELGAAGAAPPLQESDAIALVLAKSGLSSTAPALRERHPAFDAFADGAICLRLGLSNVIELNYRAPDPNSAARAANAIAAAYVRSRLARAQASVERAGGAYRAAQTAGLLAETARTRAAGPDRATPIADIHLAGARLLGAAIPPPERSSPRTAPLGLLAMTFGAVSGVLLTLWRARFRARTSSVEAPSWAVQVSHAPPSTGDGRPSRVR